MHKKEKTDAQRASVFTKIGKEISIAVREGGPDPVSNTRLRDLIQKAKANNVPNDNIERVIKKAAGGDGAQYEVVVYEGYGIGGVAVIVETTTDNRNRTAADIRHSFDKCGGNMGTTGCVSFMFADKGVIVVDGKTVADEDRFMEDVMSAVRSILPVTTGYSRSLPTRPSCRPSAMRWRRRDTPSFPPRWKKFRTLMSGWRMRSSARR